MEIKAKFERQADGWRIEVPQLDNFVTTSKRLDKATEQIKDLAQAITGEERCEIIIKVEAVMPDAVINHPAGYKMVNYAMLGIKRNVH